MTRQVSTDAVRWVLFSLLTTTVLGGVAGADVVNVEFTSTVNFIQNLPMFGISPSVGDVVTGSFSYDSNALDLELTDPEKGVYRTGHLSVTISGTTFTNQMTPSASVLDNGPPGNDLVSFVTGTLPGNDDILVDGVPEEGRIFLGFLEPVGALTSDELPNATILNSLSVAQFHVHDPDGNRLVTFGNLRTFTAVPEPSALTLSLLPVLLLAFRSWRSACSSRAALR